MSVQLLQQALKTWYIKQNKWAINGPWFMGYLGLSVLTAVKHFWYLHNDVNYCSVRALAKCPASCERSHCWHCLCSPINCFNLRLDDIAAAEKLTYSEEILIYEIKEGTKMPWVCGCPGCVTGFGVGSSFPMLETAVNDCEHQLIYGRTEEETQCAGGLTCGSVV